MTVPTLPDADAVLASLDPEQREVAVRLRGPLCVIAGAGTGKTRAITSRIAYGVLSGVLRPQQVLAVTFTARAAGEMRGRLRSLGVPGVAARTFHSAALRQLQYFWPRAVGGPLPDLISSKAPVVAAAAARLRIPTDTTTVRDLSAEIEWSKVSLVPAETYGQAAAAAGRTPPAGLDAATVTRLLTAYDEVKRERGVLDFEDVLVLTVGLLAEHTDVAGQVRGQYTSFVVDEYQDVSPLQRQLLDLWLGERDDLCVVGDPAQTIYSFAGADPRALTQFRARYRDAAEVRLVRNYRSTSPVVELANSLLAGARSSTPAVRLVSQREPGPQAFPAPRFVEYPDEPAEAAGVARAVGELVRSGVRASSIAVLFRINAQSEPYEAALAEAGVPYVVRGGERFFERPEVRQAMVLLRGAARAGDSADYAADLPAEVRAVLAAAGLSARPPSGGSAREKWESLTAIVGLAEEIAASRPGSGLAQLVDELTERAAASHAPVVEGVTLASLHAAKGLEWDAVFLVGLTDGMLPITYADTDEAVEEERRLLYVGVTRAREHLSLSWALSRAPGGRGSRRPSRFLDGLRPDTGAPAHAASGRRSGSGSGRAPATCRTCKKMLSGGAERKLGRCTSCPATYDEALFERLREWRKERSSADSVPAYVVFTDATLTAIAEARPRSVQQLAGIAGVGSTKLDRYGGEVLELCGGGGPDHPG